MTSSAASIVSVPLTLRDLQWLVLADVLTATLVNPRTPDDAIEMNVDATERYYALHYTEEEQTALRERLRAFLPPDSPLVFVPPQFPLTSAATLQS